MKSHKITSFLGLAHAGGSHDFMPGARHLMHERRFWAMAVGLAGLLILFAFVLYLAIVSETGGEVYKPYFPYYVP
ncbi:MAG: hypothetical protein H8D47_03215 [Planctomycetes bacterium]|nr:hypothetical protein [Planctomycetota bacterium]MBL7106902.1 hypothetical protein [Phycisphaerae bacterium]